MTVRFDDSLPLAADAVCEILGPDALAAGVVLRDATGRLAFFADQALDEASIAALTTRLRARLGPYARPDRVAACREDFGAEAILRDPAAIHLMVSGRAVRLLDRRIVGADWQRPPAPGAAHPPRFVFASLKGGVGRSTALAVVAAELAAGGRRVLAIDLDLEAPGIGAMLLDDDTRPEFGVIDALVENGISALDDAFLADLTGPSALAGGNGRIDVMPALGARSMRNPGDVLAKLARAYVEDVGPDGAVQTILDQVRDLVERAVAFARYDAVLIDARAGLHETAAAAILGLGAEVFLFGQDEPQTFEGYRALLSHLARFLQPDNEAPEWISRLNMVQAKLTATEAAARGDFAEQCERLFRDAGFGRRQIAPPSEKLSADEGLGTFEWNDDLPDADVLPEEGWLPRQPLAVLDDPRFQRFDPKRKLDQFAAHVYREAFGELLDATVAAIGASLEGSRENDHV